MYMIAWNGQTGTRCTEEGHRNHMLWTGTICQRFFRLALRAFLARLRLSLVCFLV